jgi:hypothetical protein
MEDNIKMDLQEVVRGVWNISSWLRIGTGTACKRGNESLGSIKYRGIY